MDLFSIIVPLYNVEDYLIQCLESIINQTYKNLEIILIDDGSTDNSGKICDEYQKKDKRIKVIHKENGGVASARNIGLENVTGDYIWFVDSDDYIELNAVDTIINKMKEENLDILVIKSYCDFNGKIIERQPKFINKNISKEILYILQTPMPWGKIYKFCVWKDFHFKNGIIYEDLGCIPGLINNATKVGFLDKFLYYYRIRQASIMRKKQFSEKIEDKYIALEELRKSFTKYGNYEKYYNEIEYLHVKHLLIVYSVEIMKYGRKIYKKRLDKAINFMNENFSNWSKNMYVKMEPIYTRVYLKLLKNHFYFLASFINFTARKILK